MTNTVWWFLNDLTPHDTLLAPDLDLAYPPTKTRPNPRDDGTDLVGRNFFEPELGVCMIIGQGPITQKQLSTRAQVTRNNASSEPVIGPGKHHTLTYKQIDTGEEKFSSVSEILYWIEAGPLLQPPQGHAFVPVNKTKAPVTTPACVPASLQYVPRTQANPAIALPVPAPDPNMDTNTRTTPMSAMPRSNTEPTTTNHTRARGKSSFVTFKLPPSQKTPEARPTNPNTAQNTHPKSRKQRRPPIGEQRMVGRRRKGNLAARNQRVLSIGKQRVSGRIRPPVDYSAMHVVTQENCSTPRSSLATRPLPALILPLPPPGYENISLDEETERFIAWGEEQERRANLLTQEQGQTTNGHPPILTLGFNVNQYLQLMPPSRLPPVFPTGPLNLNTDGTEINYRKSHAGPNADH